ncbi:HlyD family secretion protein, partial [Escherichia coli]
MTGFISQINKEDYQVVKRGEVIAEINKKEQILNRQAALAEYQKTQLALDNLTEEIKEYQLNIEKLANRYQASVIDVTQAKRSPML